MAEGWYRIDSAEVTSRHGVMRRRTLSTGWVIVYAEQSLEPVDRVPVGGMVYVLRNGRSQSGELGRASEEFVFIHPKGRIRLNWPTVSMSKISDAEVRVLREKWPEMSEWVERDWLEKEGQEDTSLKAWRVQQEGEQAREPQPWRAKWLAKQRRARDRDDQERLEVALTELDREQRSSEAEAAEELRQSLLLARELEAGEVAREMGRLRTRLKHTFLVLKASAGLLKLLCEDVVHTFVQLVFAIKFWEKLSNEMKAFTLASLSAGLAVSAAGPVKELRKLWGLRRYARTVGITEAELSLAPEPVRPTWSTGSYSEGDPAPLPEPVRPTWSTRTYSEGDPAPLPEEPALPSNNRDHPRSSHPRAKDVATAIGDIAVLDFLDPSRRHYHSSQAHRALLACAILYWAGMASMPILFGSSIKGVTFKDEGLATSNGDAKGEGDPNAFVPTSAVLFFGVITQASMFVELWVANHTRRGYCLLRDCGESMWHAVQDMSIAEPLLSIVLGLIARYDTFSDVVFTIVVMKTDPITELKFPRTLGRTIPLPCPLHWVALFALLGGVFLAQGLLGICLLLAGKHTAAALKLNEFCFLLALSELDSASEANT